MTTENQETTTQTAQKEKWQQPQMEALDINMTELDITPSTPDLTYDGTVLS